jgi:hypothetical protein
LAAWITFLKYWHEESKMSQLTYSPVKEALERIKHLSADEETRRRHTASLEQLETWAERIFDAPTLESVFEDH